MEVISFEANVRENLGTKSAKSARSNDRIPAVMYGGDEPVHFTTTVSDVRHLVYTPDFKVAEISVNGQAYRCILKDVQFHPVTDAIQHIDFLRLVEGQPVKIEVPVRFVGNSPGVRAGGKLLQNLRRVKIKALPKHMVNEVKLDISTLELGQAVRVRDIDTAEGVEILNPPSTPVAVIEIPRALRSATAAAEKAAGKK